MTTEGEYEVLYRVKLRPRSKTVGKKFIFLCCLVIANAASFAQTAVLSRNLEIGKFTYLGTNTETDDEGTAIGVSGYELKLDTTGITLDPISFSNATLFVKGTKQSSGPITTGLGCGLPPYAAPCSLLFGGGPGPAGFILANCARLSKDQDLTQNCISIALQLVSPTGKNFSFALANGSRFCAYGINNFFLLAKLDQFAVDPDASVPVILRAAPPKSCSQ